MDGWVNWTPPSELGGPVQWVTPPVSHSAMGHSCLFFFTIKPPPPQQGVALASQRGGGRGRGNHFGGPDKTSSAPKIGKKNRRSSPAFVQQQDQTFSNSESQALPYANPSPAQSTGLGARAVGVVAWRQPFRTALGFLQESFGAMPPRT